MDMKKIFNKDKLLDVAKEHYFNKIKKKKENEILLNIIYLTTIIDEHIHKDLIDIIFKYQFLITFSLFEYIDICKSLRQLDFNKTQPLEHIYREYTKNNQIILLKYVLSNGFMMSKTTTGKNNKRVK